MASINLQGDTSGSISISAPSVAGSNTLTLPATTQTLATQNSLGVRNRIINGDMRIDQRNAGASVTITTGVYTLDRWAGLATQSSKMSIQQSTTAPTGFKNSLLVTSLSAYSVLSSDAFWIAQRLEGYNIADLGWGAAGASTVTLSFWVRSSLTGTFGGALQNSARDRSYPFSYTISLANTWEQKSITITGDTTGTWLTDNGIGLRLMLSVGSGATYAGTSGAWAGADYRGATGETSVVGTNGATFYITGVQLEVGTEATPFEHRPYDMELQRCQRYFQTWGGVSNYDVVCTGVCTGGQYTEQVLNYSTTMRAAPTMTYSALGDWSAVSALASPTLAALNIDLTTSKSTRVSTEGTTSPYTAGYAVYLRGNNTTNARFNLSAEL